MAELFVIEKKFSILVNCVKCNEKFRVHINNFEDFKNYRLSLKNSNLCFYNCPHCDFVFIGTTNTSIFVNELEDEEDYYWDDDKDDVLMELEEDDVFFFKG